MRDRLQQTYRVSHELERQSVFSGIIPLKQMARLTSLLLPADVVVEVDFEFTRGDFSHDAIRGIYRAELSASCQRCLEPMSLPIEQSFELLIDASDEDVEALQMDTVYTDDGYLDLYEVIEDELILALPLIMMHEDKGCNQYLSQQADEPQPANEKPNPFAVLASLKDSN